MSQCVRTIPIGREREREREREGERRERGGREEGERRERVIISDNVLYVHIENTIELLLYDKIITKL